MRHTFATIMNSQGSVPGIRITNSFDTWDANAKESAARMTEEELSKLRTGDHPHDMDLENFCRLPVTVVPRPL